MFTVLAALLALGLLEGLASLTIVGARLLAYRPTAESHHSRHDPELGWVHRPGVRLPDFYGPGRDLTINGEGFRGPREVSASPVPGEVRLVCSGDSFTLGYGVGDADAWCERLRRPGLETVNLGQGGYGVDQAFLLYRREGARLAADVHLFAMVDVDFERLATDRFLGYSKPFLRVRDGNLEVHGVPVPRRRFGPWLTAVGRSLRELRAVELLTRFVPVPQPALRPTPPGGPVQKVEVARAVLAELVALDRERGALPVLVFLPRLGDRATADGGSWRRLVAEEAARLSAHHVDLTAGLRALPPGEARSLFILEDLDGLPGSAGHYNERGNRWVAEALWAALQELPEVAARLGSEARVPGEPGS